MESFTPSTFICERCGERHYKYLPPGTKKTTCHTSVTFWHKNVVGTSLAFPVIESRHQNGGGH